MSEHTSPRDSTTLQDVAEVFGTTTDPLAELHDKFESEKIDPFDPFVNDNLLSKGLHDDTIQHYRSVFEEWTEFMEREGRHPACPSDEHVVRYIQWQLTDDTDPRPNGRPNSPRTVKAKLRKLNRAYEYWQSSAFPHKTDFNPFELARDKVDLSNSGSKDHRRVPVDELREMLDSVTHWRSRAIIGVQLKLGLRAGEVANIRLSDLSLQNREIRRHFPDMGTEPRLKDRPNAIYVPPGDERPGNKSERARVLPLDDELRQLLVRYLLVRPDNGEPWLFLSKKSHSKINKKAVNRVWKEEFHPEYAETEKYRPVTSHFGRHRFSTYWRVEQDVNLELVKYMRGDITGTAYGARSDAIDSYLHTYYEDIEDLYLEQIYKLL